MAATGRRDVDLALLAGKTQRVPLLGLAAIFATPRPADDVARNVVREPLADFAEAFDRAHAGFLIKLAQRRRPWVLATINAALWHLPNMRFIDVFRPLGATAYEDEPGPIKHHDTHARPIRQILETGHRR